MPKSKTKKAAKKRFKTTGSGRVLHKSTRLNHLLSKKSRKRKRRMGMPSEVTGKQRKTVRELLPYDH